MALVAIWALSTSRGLPYNLGWLILGLTFIAASFMSWRREYERANASEMTWTTTVKEQQRSIDELTRSNQQLRESVRETAELPIALMTEECEYFLTILRRLMFDRPIEARLPLNNASWPAFGQPWQAIHATLYAFNSHFRAFLASARATWKAFGKPDNSVELFRVGDATVIIDLIDSLERFRNDLKRLGTQA